MTNTARQDWPSARGRRRSPRETPPAVVSKVLYLRQQYHVGAGRIADYLKRFHQAPIARSSVHRIPVKHGMRRLPADQKYQPHRKRWKRYEKPKPGHRLQMDVKFLERMPGLESGYTSSPPSMTVPASGC